MDVLREPQYMAHVEAMTAEGLHSKADIAAELAFRDIRIAALEDAMREIQWQKDCGCDGKDPATGVWTNYADVERDAMYEIASRMVGKSKDRLFSERCSASKTGVNHAED